MTSRVKSGLMPRYVEEWLKGMTCAGYLDYDAAGETYRLPDEHAFLLASDDTDHFMGGLFSMVPVLLRTAPDVATAFARGGGVKFEAFGSEAVVGLDLMNRGQYEQRLTSYWLKALPDVAARLQAGGRALDVGCGAGRVCMALAKNFPAARIVGLDPDKELIRQAESRRRCRRIVRPRIVRCCQHRRSRCERAFRSHHRLRLHPRLRRPASARSRKSTICSNRRARCSSSNPRPATGSRTTSIRSAPCSTGSASSIA